MLPSARLFWPLAVCLLASAPSAWSGAPGPEEGTPAPPDPDWFEKMLARELDPLPVLEFGSPDAYFQASAPVRVISEAQLIDGDHFIQLDAGIGPEEPVECWIYHGDMDLAASLSNLSEATFDFLAGKFGEVEARAVQQIHAGSIGPFPYLGVDWVYRVRTQQGALAGQVKHRMASRNGRALYCQQGSAGYGETFARVFRSLVETIRYAEPMEEPHYVETYVAKVQGRPIGAGRTAHFIDEDGDVRIVNFTSMLIAKEDQTLQSSDNVHVEFSRPDGSLINQVSMEAENGELTNDLRLDPAEGGWMVRGTFQGEPLEAALEAADLQSDLGERMGVRNFLREAKPGESISLPGWSDDSDPTRISEIVVTYLGREKKAKQKAFRITMRMGAHEFTGTCDADASPLEMRTDLGPVQLDLVRTHVEGSADPRRASRRR